MELALEALREAVQQVEKHEPAPGLLNLLIIKTNVHRNPLLDEPRFRELREKIGGLV